MATQRASLHWQLKNVRFLKPAYIDNFKINITRILQKWKKYITLQDRLSFNYKLANSGEGTANPANWGYGSL